MVEQTHVQIEEEFSDTESEKLRRQLGLKKGKIGRHIVQTHKVN